MRAALSFSQKSGEKREGNQGRFQIAGRGSILIISSLVDGNPVDVTNGLAAWTDRETILIRNFRPNRVRKLIQYASTTLIRHH